MGLVVQLFGKKGFYVEEKTYIFGIFSNFAVRRPLPPLHLGNPSKRKCHADSLDAFKQFDNQEQQNMKTKRFFSTLLVALLSMVGAWAQYLNVKLADGTWRSFKTSSDMEVSFGEKAGLEPTESAQTVTVGDYKVTVKLADNAPANEVVFSTNMEGDAVKIMAVSLGGYGLECIKDNEVLTPAVSNGFHTFTVSNISKDVVVTVGYITVSFDLNNSNITDNFKDKPADITKMGYNSTIAPTYASAEKHSFRGWYTDKECTEAWNYSTGVTKSMTLYAKWAEDPTGTKINEHEFVKLGGYYWATENVYKATNVTTKSDGDEQYGSYYTQTDDNALNAAKSWGSEGNYSWTLPSEAQWQALLDYCDWMWYTNYNGTGMNGMLVTGRDGTYESGHSIFLPAAGICRDGGHNVDGQGDDGYYWSADLEIFNGLRDMDYDFPSNGMTVRPILAE